MYKYRFSALSISFPLLLLTACSGAPEAEMSQEDAASQEQAITGGTQVNGDAPYTVKLTFPGGGFCSGIKIGPTRFLTAGHCIWPLSSGTQVSITNRDDGTGSTAFTITALHKYPTNPANMASGHITDVGMIDVQQTSPDIAAYNIFRAAYVSDGTANGWADGFGCNASNPSLFGKKQHALFTTAFNADPPSNAGYIFAQGNAGEDICPGDSGGPLFFFANGNWEIAGINVAAGSYFTRIGRVIQWIANPMHNSFAHNSKGSLLNASGNNCVKGVAGSGSNLTYCDLRNLPTDSQYWTLTQISPGRFNLKNTATGQCLSNAAGTVAGSPTWKTTCSSTTAMQWEFVLPVSANGFSYYHVRNIATDLCLGTASHSVNNGTAMRMQNCTVGSIDSQTYAFVP